MMSDTLTSMGGFKKTIILASEPNKITITLTASADIKQGQGVKLDANGKATPWATADGRLALFGFAAMDVASGGKVTVWSRGYGIIRGVSADAQNAGPVTYNPFNATAGYNEFKATSTESEAVGWALSKATAAGQEILVVVRD